MARLLLSWIWKTDITAACEASTENGLIAHAFAERAVGRLQEETEANIVVSIVEVPVQERFEAWWRGVDHLRGKLSSPSFQHKLLFSSFTRHAFHGNFSRSIGAKNTQLETFTTAGRES